MYFDPQWNGNEMDLIAWKDLPEGKSIFFLINFTLWDLSNVKFGVDIEFMDLMNSSSSFV